MPETAPRWLLVGAGIVALITILVGVKDFAQRKTASNPSSGPGSETVAHSDLKSAAETIGKKKRARGSATAVNDSVTDTPPAELAERFPMIEGIVQAGARAPLVTEDSVNKGRPGSIESKTKPALARCSPLPNSTKLEDVDAPYYQNWAREYGCGAD